MRLVPIPYETRPMARMDGQDLVEFIRQLALQLVPVMPPPMGNGSLSLKNQSPDFVRNEGNGSNSA